MLVRGGVEHDLGSLGGEDDVERGDVADVAQRDARPAGHALQRVVQVGLVVVEEHQRRGLERRDLADDLGADPAAAAR